MIEIIITDTDGKQWCRELQPGEFYEMRGDEVSIEVYVKDA